MACEKARKSGKRTGQKRSRKDPPKQDRLLEELNRTRISMDGWMALLTAIENIPAEDRSFESLVIAAGEVFDDLDEALAAIIRWQAILRLVQREIIPGWFRKSDDPCDQGNDVWEVKTQIMQAAATAPIIVDEMERPYFDKDELLKAAFKLGK
ncbi:MAG: hypothetical protein PHT96_04920 [Syntrophorhabdaceae bacterium]|nr:hypothetical protein [Syntrophorhabdaceae bacterium]MDD4195743.1 hypothetical protein [Syntrophorhabdaceae bacterium]